MKEIDSPISNHTFRASDFAGVDEHWLRPVRKLKSLT